jgi:hypothetical protein
VVVAVDASGNASIPVDVPTITRLQNRDYTTAGSATASHNSTSTAEVNAPYTDDVNGNNSLRVEWKLSTDSAYSPANRIDVAHSASPYVVTITGLAPKLYDVRVTYLDVDGVNGSAVQVVQVDASGSSPGGVGLTNLSVVPNPFAPRASQTTTITFTLQRAPSDPIDRIMLRMLDGQGNQVRLLLNCVDMPAGTYQVPWDGRNDANVFQDNGMYRLDLQRFNDQSNCLSNATESLNTNVIISNAAAIELSPPPGQVTLGPGESQTITATVYNGMNDPISSSGGVNGARVSFTTSAGTLSVTPANCSSPPPAGTTCTDANGQAFATLTLPSGAKNPQIITITATVIGNGGAAVTATTTINDPPTGNGGDPGDTGLTSVPDSTTPTVRATLLYSRVRLSSSPEAR